MESPVFPDERSCARILRESRWPGGEVRCVKCGSRKVVRDGMRGDYRKYRCRECGSYFNDRSGTIFQDTKVPLGKWAEAARLIESEVPVLRVSEMIDVSYRNAYYIAKKIRESQDRRIFGLLRALSAEAAPPRNGDGAGGPGTPEGLPAVREGAVGREADPRISYDYYP